MSLISIKDYTGSEIAKAAMEALDMVGIVNKLNINGYHISIDGIQSKTPKGMIEDMPAKHKVIIDRNKFVREADKEQFELLNITDALDEELQEQEKFNLDFEDTGNKVITHQFSFDSNSYIWYKHKVEFEVDRGILETQEAYVKRLFEEIANYVVESFESMT